MLPDFKGPGPLDAGVLPSKRVGGSAEVTGSKMPRQWKRHRRDRKCHCAAMPSQAGSVQRRQPARGKRRASARLFHFDLALHLRMQTADIFVSTGFGDAELSGLPLEG